MRELYDLLGPAFVPLRALGVTFLGVYLAELWYQGAIVPLLVLILIPFGVAYACFYVGRSLLDRKPTGGLVLMEVWILAPLIIAVIAVGATVILAVELAVPAGASSVQKELAGTISAALAVFLTSSFVAWTEDQDTSRIASKIRDAFWSKVKRRRTDGEERAGVLYVEAGSVAERLIYSNLFHGLTGWGLATRWKRANRLREELLKAAPQD